MRPQQALESVVRAIDESPLFEPNDIITDEFDPEGRNNRLQTPFVVVLPVGTQRVQNHNTDRVGFTTDASGDQTGGIFETIFEMQMQLDIYLAAGDDRNVTTLGGRLRDALLTFDSAVLATEFPPPSPSADSSLPDDIRDFDAGTGQRADDLSGPGVRRWRHSAEMRFVSRIKAVDVEGEYQDTDDPETVETGVPFTEIVTPTDPDLQPVDDDAADFEYDVE
jgi:hypothetical protein